MVPSEAAYAQADRPQSLPASQEAADEEDEIIFQGNSFLIEEAYNQEPGVVQHVFNFVRGWDEGRGHSRAFDFFLPKNGLSVLQRTSFRIRSLRVASQSTRMATRLSRVQASVTFN